MRVKQVVEVPSAGAQSTSVAFEDPRVNGKHLLHEGPPEMKQAHWERGFVFRSECDSSFLQTLTEGRSAAQHLRSIAILPLQNFTTVR